MILPFLHAVNAFMTIWLLLPLAIRSMAVVFMVSRLFVGALDFLTMRT